MAAGLAGTGFFATGFAGADFLARTGFFVGFFETAGALAGAGFLAVTVFFTGLAIDFFATEAGFDGLIAGFAVLFFGAVFRVFFFAAMAQR